MGLEDFERDLAQAKDKSSERNSGRPDGADDERKRRHSHRRHRSRRDRDETRDQSSAMPEAAPPSTTAPLDSAALNRLRAKMLKARLQKDPSAAELEKEFEAASLAKSKQPDVVLNLMDSRQLAGSRGGEVNVVNTKRGRERGLVEENEDMSIADMVRAEKRSKGISGGAGRDFAERIAKDAKFAGDLEYMDENAARLAKSAPKSDINLRNTAISDFSKRQKILAKCPLCYHEDTSSPPVAPIVSLATRTYLTLPTEPELTRHGAVIVPLQHHLNLISCDNDEWEEIRNFMKSLTRFYHQQDKGVIFYENAAHSHSRQGHATLNAVPLPRGLAETAPAYFKEAITSSAETWSQHRPIIDTLSMAQKPGYGRQAFRKAIPKEMPYFHVFFSLDGGMGHVVEDEQKWPKGDLFAREVVGGMLDRGPEVVKKQGRWEKGDRRVETFRKAWTQWDWTKVLMEDAT